MAYPTGVVFQPSMGAPMGMQPIGEAIAAKLHELGTIVRAKDATYGEGTFIYLTGVASTVPGDVVCFNSKTGGTVRAVAAGATSVGSVAVAMSACDATTKYGWYCVAGSVPVTAATVAADTQAYLTATAGSVDDLASATAVVGMTFKAATSAGFATAQLAMPTVDATALTGTTQTIAGAKTFSSTVSAPSLTTTNLVVYGDSASGEGVVMSPRGSGAALAALAVDTTTTVSNGYILDLRNNGSSKFTVNSSGTPTGSNVYGFSGGNSIFSGTGSPEGATTAPVGSFFLRRDGGAGTCAYIKESGSGNTGWKALVGI